jgi:outer membrane biosynthesis protein TonB
MTLKKHWVLCSLLAAGMFVVVPQASSDEWNKKTEVKIGDPVQVPGAVLQPGNYVFKLADSQSNRHIVQIFKEDGSELITTIIAIPNYRLDPADDTVLEFWETPSGSPAALRAWFYPGDNFGQEFRYPSDEAAALSASTRQEVPSMTEEDVAALESQKSSASETAKVDEQAPVEEPQSTESEVTTTESEVTPPEVQPAQELPREEPETEKAAAPPAPESQPEPEVQSQPDSAAETDADEDLQAPELPRTAGYLPLVGLSGLLAVGAATLVRLGRNR